MQIFPSTTVTLLNITLVKLCNEKCWHGKIITINYCKTQMPIKVQTNRQTENKSIILFFLLDFIAHRVIHSNF